ncbi:MAG TPA: carbohydrate ABC transporter permease [Ktedonosporobacter sp.]|nr:carbohydrate ABC transporter permease [Ktedonosporobacter sp.]
MQFSWKKQTYKPIGKRQLNVTWQYIVLMVLAFVFIAPFLWLINTALKDTSELAAYPIHWLPTVAQWNNFAQSFTVINFPAYAANSLVLASMYATLITLSSSLVGFGFARLRGRGKRSLLLIMLSTLMLPSILTVIPTYVLFARLNLIDTYWPWVLWGLASSPFHVFLFRQFFSAIPLALEEAAIIDGCSYFRMYCQIFLPLSFPVIATSFILSFTWVWGDYITPSLFLSQNNTTLAVAMSLGYTDGHGNILTNVLAAGSVLYVLPVLLIFVFAQRYFVRGIVTSGVRG